MLGTNPIAMAFPAKECPPVVVDLATSVVPFGKVQEYARMCKKLPRGWATNAQGDNATEPAEVMQDGC